jgi:hypothetical protein
VTVESARPQDVERPHRRTRGGTPAPETLALLERYRGAMRAELEDLLAEIRPAPVDTGQLAIDGAIPTPRPKLEERRALWDLAIKLGRELSSVTLEPGWEGALDSGKPETGRRAGVRAPRLSRRDRSALGQE